MSGAVSGAQHCFPKKNHAELVRARALRKSNAYLTGQLASLDRQRSAVLQELRENRNQLEYLRQPWEATPSPPIAELAATKWNERALIHVDSMQILSQWGHLSLESLGKEPPSELRETAIRLSTLSHYQRADLLV